MSDLMHGLVRPSPRELALQDEVEELRERVRQLEAMLDGDAQVPQDWPLTPQENRVARALLSRDIVSKVSLVDICERADWTSPDRDDAEALVRVVVCRVRRKLRTYDIDVRTKWGFGYYIPAEQRKAVLAREAT